MVLFSPVTCCPACWSRSPGRSFLAVMSSSARMWATATSCARRLMAACRHLDDPPAAARAACCPVRYLDGSRAGRVLIGFAQAIRKRHSCRCPNNLRILRPSTLPRTLLHSVLHPGWPARTHRAGVRNRDCRRQDESSPVSRSTRRGLPAAPPTSNRRTSTGLFFKNNHRFLNLGCISTSTRSPFFHYDCISTAGHRRRLQNYNITNTRALTAGHVGEARVVQLWCHGDRAQRDRCGACP